MEKNVKSTQEILVILNKRIAKHIKEIEKTVEDISNLKKQTSNGVTPEHRQFLLKSAMVITEHKGIVSALNEIIDEIKK